EVRGWKDARALLDKVWARGRVRELEDRYVIERADKDKLEKEIVQTSLRFGVLSRFTAFVAVDRAAIVNPGGETKQVTQAVEHPAAWGQTATLAAAAAPPNAPGMARMRSLGGFGGSVYCFEAMPETASSCAMPAPSAPAAVPRELEAQSDDFDAMLCD